MWVGKSRFEEDNLFKIKLLTIQQVAVWAKVSPKTVYRWIQKGKLPVIKFGYRIYRIPANSVIEHLKNSGYEHLVDEPPESR